MGTGERRFGLGGGFTYAGVLAAVALVGIGLASAGVVWETASRREKERELLFVGEQYRRAIASYFHATPGAAKEFPPSLDDLILDQRHPVARRHLRKKFRDPITGSRDWGLVRGPGKRIMGVYSRSERAPIKTDGFPPALAGFSGATSYIQWRFVHIPDWEAVHKAQP